MAPSPPGEWTPACKCYGHVAPTADSLVPCGPRRVHGNVASICAACTMRGKLALTPDEEKASNSSTSSTPIKSAP